jgi:hypothetical protein
MCSAAQQGGEAVPPPANRGFTSEQIGPAADWKPTQDFLTRVYAACDKRAANYDECFMAHMSNAGAPPEVVHITRLLYRSRGEVAIVSDLQKAGPVDMIRVEFPLRATDNLGLLLVNGDQKILDVDDMEKLNRGEMETAPHFQAVKQRYPRADVWPGDRSGVMWPAVSELPDGGTEIVIGYPILDGCQTCAHIGLAWFGWDFDAKGKFLKTRYIPVPPPPKKLQRETVPPLPSTAPAR